MSKLKYNAYVKLQQQRLTRLGFLCGKADGLAGSKTKGAIKRFQQAWNLGTKLADDGVWGAKTEAAMTASEKAGGKLSKNFKASEFRCKCNGKYSTCEGIIAYRADIAALEELRAKVYPKGLRIVSAYRCKSHNKAVGGASSSQHLKGKAYDIPAVVKPGDSRIPARFRGRGYNRGNQLVRHVDSRSTVTRWIYG